MSLEKRFGFFRSTFVQRNKIPAASAFERLLTFARVREEMLERREQERTEFPQLPVRPQVDFVLDQIGKKSLGQVLGVVDGVTAAADIGVERRPVSLAKLRQGGARRLGVCLRSSRGRDHAPVRGREGISLAVNGSRQILHGPILTTAQRNAKLREARGEFLQQPPDNPFVKGESNHPEPEERNLYETNIARHVVDSHETNAQQNRASFGVRLRRDHVLTHGLGESCGAGDGPGTDAADSVSVPGAPGLRC